VMNKVMNNFRIPIKSIVFELVNENVIPINLKQKFKKGQFLLPFFLIVLNICDELNFS